MDKWKTQKNWEQQQLGNLTDFSLMGQGQDQQDDKFFRVKATLR